MKIKEGMKIQEILEDKENWADRAKLEKVAEFDNKEVYKYNEGGYDYTGLVVIVDGIIEELITIYEFFGDTLSAGNAVTAVGHEKLVLINLDTMEIKTKWTQ